MIPMIQFRLQTMLQSMISFACAFMIDSPKVGVKKMNIPYRSAFCTMGLGVAFLLSGCSGPKITPLVQTPSPVRATSRPYVIKNKCYVPQKHFELVQTGIASYYGGRDGCHGAKTALGERFNMFHLSAAHKTLPLPSMIKVENLENGKNIIVRVNDRGPFARNRILDVSMAAAQKLGFYRKGYAKVRIYTLVEESLKLAENQPGFRKNRSKSALDASNLLHQRYYVKVGSGNYSQAKGIKKAIAHWGKTDLRKTSRQFHVLLGPYSTRLGALEVCQRMPKFYSPTVICERNNRSKTSLKSQPYPSSGKRSQKNKFVSV